MKKLTEDHFKLLKSKYPVLSMEELAQILGGDVSWDCLFQYMNYIDPSRSVAEYVALYTASTGSNPSLSGGVPTGSVTSILSLAGFSSTNNNNTSSTDSNISNLMIIDNGQGQGHAVELTGSSMQYAPKKDKDGKEMKDENGDTIMEMQLVIGYYDPTIKQKRQITADEAIAIYQVQKPNASGSGSANSSSSGSN